MTGEERLALTEERDHLLRSLDDLDAELAAGDIDRHDYDELKDAYVARTAAVLRALGESTDGTVTSRTDPTIAAGRPSGEAARRSRWWRWALGLTVLGVLAGLGLAQAAGERGTQGLTGSVEASIRDRILECQQIGTDLSRLLESLQCFDTVLDEDPQNVEALTYRGWYVVLASRTALASGDQATADELLRSALSFLDRAVGVSPSYPDARAFRAAAREQQGDTAAACEDIDVLAGVERPSMIDRLVDPLAERLGCPMS